MSDSGIRIGIYFGLTSGVITTLGLMAGLEAGTESRLAVVGGIITIAVADALSDALGIHITREAQPGVSSKSVWAATISTMATKMAVALTFLLPVLLLDLGTAMVAAVLWGMLIIVFMSLAIARAQGSRPIHVVAEHLGIAILVVVITHYLGKLIHYYLGVPAV